MPSLIQILERSDDYELVDSGEGEKLERFGAFTLVRPDPQALWTKGNASLWKNASLRYVRTGPKTGKWEHTQEIPERWNISCGGLSFIIRPTTFKHVGLFPEQVSNWEWLADVVKTASRPLTVLNLFGYTGGATLACAKAGASVTHVDSSKVAVTWANENRIINNLPETSIRWILEDAFVFVQKEVRRGKRYDGIIMDPPTFGHGTKGELWKIEKQFTDLVADCHTLLGPQPTFFLINGYSAGYSSITYANNLQPLVTNAGGTIEHGELAIRETAGKRLLPAGIFARWKK